MNSIQIFACDHRKNVKWDLPYIRLGNYQSDAALNIKDDEEIAPYQLLLSEGAQMWWVNKHYMELGNPDYIGFFHYRRFFTLINKYNLPIIDIKQSSYKSSYAITPLHILNIQNQFNFSIATIMPIKVAIGKSIYEQIEYLDHAMTYDINKQLFTKFKLYLPQKYNDVFENACNQPNTHLCNIFIMNREKFFEYINAAIKSLVEFHRDFYKDEFHTRYLGYYMERLTSTFIYCNILLNEKIMYFPVMTIEGNFHAKP